VKRLFPSRFFAGVLFAVLPSAAACDSDPDDGTPALSEECDECLSRGACAASWESCIENQACDTHVVCMVREQCYTAPATSSCAADAGCELPGDVEEEVLQLSQDFETCARTECAELCGFVDP
jgi:hypothetical protein